MSLQADDLVLCAGTLGAAPLREKLEAAAAAGFSGASIFMHELAKARAEGFAARDVRALAADLGLGLAELDPLLDWLPAAGGLDVSGDGAAMASFGVEEFLEAGEALGMRSINTALFGTETVELDQVVEAFAAVCDRAAEHGLLVNLEFVAFSQLSNFAAALEVVESAGRDNGGVMLDSMHQLRSGGTHAQLRAAGARVNGIQLNDTTAQAAPDPVAETLHARLLPGEGDADPASMLRELRAGGCIAPVGVEVFSDVLNGLAPREAAGRAARAARQVIEQARGA